MEKPNILLLTTDQQRFDTIAAMGYPYMDTPNLDRLVREGCGVPLAYSPNPACVPARHNIISGQYSRVTGFDDNYFDGERLMPPGLPTAAGILADAGYETVAVGKMHFSPCRNHNGFGRMELMEEIPRWRQDDEYASYLETVGEGAVKSLHGVRNVLYMLPQNPLQEEVHAGTCWVADRLIHHIKTNDGKRPFFYWGSWIAPHPPLSVPKKYADQYKGKDLPLPIPPDRSPKPLTVENSRIGDYYDEEIARRSREYYYGAISWVDEQIGRVLKALEETGQLDQTIIVFTSDHGELLGDHGSYQKFQPYEGSCRIPMIIRAPGYVKPGSVYEGFADLNDILPTVLDAAGLSYPGELPLPGDSLLRPVTESSKNRMVQFAEHNHEARRWIFIRDRRFKYVYYYSGGMEELFDLEQDPQERVNLLENLSSWMKPEYDRLKTQLLEWELTWGLGSSAGTLKAYPPLTLQARLPASFPLFHKKTAHPEKMLSDEQEIRKASKGEPVLDLSRLCWADWIERGLIDEKLKDRVLEK